MGSTPATAKPLLRDFQRNDYSQWGEDGIIEKIFQLIGAEDRTCIEFGAWDGLYLANTARLWKDQGWKGILIEGSAEKFAELSGNVRGHDCVPIQAMVGVDPGRDSLEYLLRQHGLPLHADFLSIDIDGNDYYVFESLDQLRPRCVACEYNPTVPYFLDIYAKYDNHFGCSAASLVRLGKRKGYTLVGMTPTNCFFVRDEDAPRFADIETDLDRMAIKQGLNFIATDYDGNYVLVGNLWYGMRDRTPAGLNLGAGLTIDPASGAIKIDLP
jgi:hypothetical protein